MSETARTARGTLVVGAGQLALALAGFVAALLLARELGPGAYGVWGIVYSILAGVEQIGRLGIPQATSRLVAEAGGRDRILERRATTLVGLLFALLFLGLWFAAPRLEEIFAIPDGTRLLRIAAFDVVPFGLFAVAIAVLNGRRDFVLEGTANVVYAGTRILGLLLVLPFGLTIEAALWVTVASSLCGLLAAFARIGPGILGPRFDGFGPILAVAAPVAVAWGASGLLSQLDLWALNAFGTGIVPEVKGWYTAALNLARLPNLLAFVATSILVPTIARALSAADRPGALGALREGSRWMLILLVPMAAIGAVEAREIMSLVFGPAFAEGGSLLALLILAHGVLYTGFVTLGSVLLAAGRERISALLAPAAAGMGLVLLPLGTMLFGAAGTALGSLGAGLFACTIGALAVHRLVGPLLEPSALLRILLAGAGAAALASVVPGQGFWLIGELALVGLAYLALLLATGAVARDEVLALLGAGARNSVAPRAAAAAPMDGSGPSV